MIAYLTIILFIVLCGVFLVPSSIVSATQQVFEETSPQVVTPNDKIAIKISTISDPSIDQNFVVRVVSPDGQSYSYNVSLHSDSLGFATGIISYPNSFLGASTNQQGNYSIFIQDPLTRNLVKSSFFQINSLTPGTSNFLATVLLPVLVVPVAGGLITYLYNYWAKKRDEQKALQEKKSEYFLSVSPSFWHVVIRAQKLSNVLSRPRPLNQKSILQKTDTNNAKVQIKIDEKNLVCLYSLLFYLKARAELVEKVGAFVLDDPNSEDLLQNTNAKITCLLENTLGPSDIGKLQKLLPDKGNIADLESSIIKDEPAMNIFLRFEAWLTNEKEINDLVNLLNFYADESIYEINRFFRDWYTDRKEMDVNIRSCKTKADQSKEKVKEILK